jgi:transcription elongation GreA/GreB family factor
VIATLRAGMDKPAIVSALLEQLTAEISRATAAANRSRHDATHEEARPENDKDTRALETSYLARGQAQRVVELESAERQVRFMTLREFGRDDPIDLSALVEVESDGASTWYLIAPAAGGHKVSHAGMTIDVLTPEAPLGRVLIGRVCGEDLELRVGGRVRELSILQVR